MNKAQIFKISLAALIMLGTTFTSCKKYEDGPAISLRTKKARVANQWKIAYAYDMKENVDITADYTGEIWEFKKDGEFVEWSNGAIDKTGTWDFVSDKEAIQIIILGDVDYYTIQELKEKEMWVYDAEEELQLIPAN